MATKLKEYISGISDKPFCWSSHNCMSFVVGYLDLRELPVDWFLGHTDAKSCYKAYRAKAKEIQFESLADVFDTVLQREITLHPKSGFVVGRRVGGLFGYLYGIHHNGFNLFLTEEAGLRAFDVEHSDIYWRQC